MGKKTGPATEAPSAYPAGDEAAGLAALMFGDVSAGSYQVVGRLIRIDRLPVSDLGLLTVGFRITDRPSEKWTRRFNQFKYGEPYAARAATRTFCAAFSNILFTGDPRVVVVSSVSSGQKHCAKRHAGVETGVRPCRIPGLGVASASRHQGSASQPHRRRLRGRAGLHRRRGVPGCPHRRRTRLGDRRRRLLHAGRDVHGHRPRDPGVQPRMAYSAG